MNVLSILTEMSVITAVDDKTPDQRLGCGLKLGKTDLVGMETFDITLFMLWS